MPKSEPRGVIRVLHTDEAPAIFWRAAAAMGGRECDRIRLQDALAEKYPGVWSAKDLSRSMALELVAQFVDIEAWDAFVRGRDLESNPLQTLKRHLQSIEALSLCENASYDVEEHAQKALKLFSHIEATKLWRRGPVRG